MPVPIFDNRRNNRRYSSNTHRLIGLPEIIKKNHNISVVLQSNRRCHRRHCAIFWCEFLCGWFSYFEGNILNELFIIMHMFWIFFDAWSKWKFFCYKIYFERPRYVLSSTTIVITTSPSSTRALRPLVPLHWLRKQRGNLIPLEKKRRSYITAETIICLSINVEKEN